MNLRNTIFALALALLALTPAYGKDERVDVGLAVVDDGNCERIQRTLSAGYERETDVLSIWGRFRNEPAAGDCRQSAISYDVAVYRYFAVFDDALDLTVKFGAQEQVAAAPYALATETGEVMRRPDGGALFRSYLPAGVDDTVTGAIGISKDLGFWRPGVMLNMVPVDWSEHEPGMSVHLTSAFDYQGIDFNVAIDVGADWFGEAYAGYHRALDKTRFDLVVGLTYKWGITATDVGAPYNQSIRGTPFVLFGPVRDNALIFEVGIGYRL